MKNYDETINSFKKVVELKPDLYEGNYYLGLFYTVKADAMNTEMGQKNYRSQSEYDADLKEVNVVYMAALPYFEKAHQLKPDDVDTVDYIKSISFRLRDEPGMMDKYNEYNELLKKMKGWRATGAVGNPSIPFRSSGSSSPAFRGLAFPVHASMNVRSGAFVSHVCNKIKRLFYNLKRLFFC